MTPGPGRKLCAFICEALLNKPRPPPNCSFAPRNSTPRTPFPPVSPAAAWRVWRSKNAVSRGFAGFCAFTSVPPSTATTTSATTTAAAAVADTRIDRVGSGGALDRRKICWMVGEVWGKRNIHTEARRLLRSAVSKRDEVGGRDGHMGKGNNGNSAVGTKRKSNGKPLASKGGVKKKVVDEHGILDRISHIHRPTKDEMLAAATGAFQRLRIRTKWSLIRQMRPYNLEDIGAFFSWLFLGHILWVVLGTTTFLSMAIFLVNTVFAQETLAGAIGNYLTKETGIKVVFESAIVPRWKDGCISFKNVFVSRRPGHDRTSQKNVRKGSSVTAAAAAAAAVHADGENPSSYTEELEEESANYTQFDVTIDTVNVTLSFTKWMNGKGLLEDVEIKGVRGVIDRTHVHWEEDVDPRSFRHEHNPGDFEIGSFKLEDLLVTVYQVDDFRPFSVSIFSCDLPQLRKQWLFYDFLSANHMSGSFDDSLFTIHPRQSHGITPSMLSTESDSSQTPWKKTSRLRIDGLQIDHLNRGIEGPFSWIHSGNVDIIADVMFPADDNLEFSKVFQEFIERMEASVSSSSSNSHLNPLGAEKEKRFVVMDLHVQLNDVRAAVPIFTKDLSYVNSALVRPIVAYINTRKTYIPINCRVVKRASEFDGSWTIYDSGLMDDLSAETYEAFARNVLDEQARIRRFRKVGLWSLQLAAQALLMAMAGNLA